MKSCITLSRCRGSMFVAFALAGLATSLRGEPTPAPRPSPPPGSLLGRAPELASWVIQDDVQSSVPEKPEPEGSSKKNKVRKELPKDSPAPKSAEQTRFTKSGFVLHIEVSDGRTNKMDKWCRGDVQATMRPEWSEPLVSVASNPFDAGYTDYSKSDFPEFAWISKKNYAGLEEFQDHACLVFKDQIEAPGSEGKVPAGPSTAANPTMVDVTAYIDYYSRLPVRLVRGDVARSYHFAMPPARSQEIPPNIQSVLDERQKHMKDLTRPPAKPY